MDLAAAGHSSLLDQLPRGFYILGLVIGACYAVDYIFRLIAANQWGLGPVPENPAPSTLIRARRPVYVFAALLNPYFEEGAFFPFVLFRKFTVDQDFYSKNVGEFTQPITVIYKFGVIFLSLNAEILLWLAAAASFVALLLRRRFSVFRALLFAGFSYLAWKASRNTNIFSMVAGFVLAENLSEFLLLPTEYCRHSSTCRTAIASVAGFGHWRSIGLDDDCRDQWRMESAD